MPKRSLEFLAFNAIALLFYASGLLFYLFPLLIFYISKRFSFFKGILFSLILLLELMLVLVLLKQWPGKAGSLDAILSFLSWLPGFAYYRLWGFKGMTLGIFSYWLLLASLGLFWVYFSKKTNAWFLLIFKVALATFVVFLIYLGITVKGDVFTLIAGLKEYLNQNLEVFLSMPQKMESEELLFLKKNQELIVKGMMLITPGFLFCALQLVNAVNVGLSRALFKTQIHQETQLFELMNLSFAWIWLFIATLGLYIANSYGLLGLRFEALLTNFLLVFGLAFFFQGLAVVQLFLKRFGLDTWVIVLIYLSVLMLMPPLVLIVFFVGIADAWVDFRKLNKIS